MQPGLDQPRPLEGDRRATASSTRPIPSSQKISTIGGNVGTNAGGPHCLSYGTTTNHVLGLEYVDDAGVVIATHRSTTRVRPHRALVGSEGTLGIVTAVDVRLMAMPEAVRVWVLPRSPTWNRRRKRSRRSSRAGIVPTALEIMDKMITRRSKRTITRRLPADAGAGTAGRDRRPGRRHGRERSARSRASRSAHGALRGARARDAAERDALWARAKARPARSVRIAPELLHSRRVRAAHETPAGAARDRSRSRASTACRSATSFTPATATCIRCLMFDRRDRRTVRRSSKRGPRSCVPASTMGGTISGEHGIGYEKRDALSLVFAPPTSRRWSRVRDVFDPRAFSTRTRSFRRARSAPKYARNERPRAARRAEERRRGLRTARALRRRR